MSVVEIEQLLKNYREWLKDKTTLRQIDGSWVEITTPYLDRHNDALQIYVRRENGTFVLTDEGVESHKDCRHYMEEQSAKKGSEDDWLRRD
jgi:hypothetical protein